MGTARSVKSIQVKMSNGHAKLRGAVLRVSRVNPWLHGQDGAGRSELAGKMLVSFRIDSAPHRGSLRRRDITRLVFR